MKFRLGQPEHGWVQLVVAGDDFHLQDFISYVPNDFIDGMIRALPELIEHGTEQQIPLSLEPSHHVITLGRLGAQYSFSIEPYAPHPQGLIHRTTGPLGEIVLPIDRAIKGFRNQRGHDQHWPNINEPAFQRMVQVVAHARNAER